MPHPAIGRRSTAGSKDRDARPPKGLQGGPGTPRRTSHSARNLSQACQLGPTRPGLVPSRRSRLHSWPRKGVSDATGRPRQTRMLKLAHVVHGERQMTKPSGQDRCRWILGRERALAKSRSDRGREDFTDRGDHPIRRRAPCRGRPGLSRRPSTRRPTEARSVQASVWRRARQ